MKDSVLENLQAYSVNYFPRQGLYHKQFLGNFVKLFSEVIL